MNRSASFVFVGCLCGAIPAIAQAADLGTAFTYQGHLENGSGAVTSTCDFRFGLWDAPSGGDPIGASPQTKTGVAVSNGVFTVQDLDFGDTAFDGTGRWLRIEVKCPPDGGFTVLAPRVELTPTPHAMAVRGLRTENGNGDSPNLVMGYAGNAIEAGVIGVNIGGGGGTFSGTDGRCAGDPSILCQIDLDCANAQAEPCVADASVGRCDDDQALCSADVECLTGTCMFPVSPNVATADFATIGGGFGNRAGGEPVLAGQVGSSRPPGTGAASTIGGGAGNTASGVGSTVGGGTENRATAFKATVSGGFRNEAAGLVSSVGGGDQNEAWGDGSTVGGGGSNESRGFCSTVPGGLGNVASGDYSFAAGREAIVRVGDRGTFVWADAPPSSTQFVSTGENQFLIRAVGGVGIEASASPSDILPLASLHLRNLDLSLAADDLENDDLIIESNDAVLGLYSHDDGTFGSAIALKDLEVNGTLNDTWGIVRQSSGTGDSSLRFTYGTGDNYATNATYLAISATGFVGLSDLTPDAVLDVHASSAAAAKFNRLGSFGPIVEFEDDGVVVGTISFDAGGTVTYGAFTGSHIAWTQNTEAIEQGALVSMTGSNRRWHDLAHAEIVYGIAASTSPNDSRCLGAYQGLLNPAEQFSADNPHQVMAVGNGDMWVVDTGRNIEPGQYLISSDIQGHAMLDDAERFPVGYVVARAGEGVDWAKVSAAVDGRKHKRISVFFESFERGSTINLSESLKPHQAEIEALKSRVLLLEQALTAQADVPQANSLFSSAGFALPVLALSVWAGLATRGRRLNGGAR